ncbi:MAG: hypothetical protein GXO95_01455, partial [Nitrospirae bacterium]|nr:hypothetical protein [Nitrospirota bacterium]
LASSEDTLMSVEDIGSPTTIITGRASNDEIKTAASLTARYSDAKHLTQVEVTISTLKGISYKLKCKPATDDLIEGCRIVYNKREKDYKLTGYQADELTG